MLSAKNTSETERESARVCVCEVRAVANMIIKKNTHSKTNRMMMISRLPTIEEGVGLG